MGVCGAQPGLFTLDGADQLRRRPVGDMEAPLAALGARMRYAQREGYPPVVIQGARWCGGPVEVPGETSSQFLSGLLLGAPLAAAARARASIGGRVAIRKSRDRRASSPSARVETCSTRCEMPSPPRRQASWLPTHPKNSSTSFWHAEPIASPPRWGALATAGYGTALGVVRAAFEAGKGVAVFADETRPFLQGARLTAWEMVQENIPVTLITDNMAGHFMKTGGKEYGLDESNVGALLERLCPEETHCAAVRLGNLVIVTVPGEMAAGLGLQLKAAARRACGVDQVAIGGLADEWISYVLSPEEYSKGGYEASMSFYGENLGAELVSAGTRAANAALSPLDAARAQCESGRFASALRAIDGELIVI